MGEEWLRMLNSSERSKGFLFVACVLIAVLSPLPATIQVGFPVLGRTSTNGNNTYANFTGALTSTHCVSIDANHNLIDNGTTCAGAGPGGDNITSPNGSLTIGGTPSNTTLDSNTAYLNGLYAQLAVSNLFANGVKNTMGLSATTAGLRLTPGTLPSVQAAGDCFMNATGIVGCNDGSNADAFLKVAGSGTAYGAAPGSGNILLAAANYHVSSLAFPGGTTNFLRADGSFAAPPSGNPPHYWTSGLFTGIGPTSFTPAAGTLITFDATPSTGSTKHIIQAGAGQSSGNMIELQDNSGGVWETWLGVAQSAPTHRMINGKNELWNGGAGFGGAPKWQQSLGSGSYVERIANDGIICWTTDARSDTGTLDTCISRGSTTLLSSAPVQLPLYTVSSGTGKPALPTCNAGLEGAEAGVVDLLTPTFLAIAVGGGAVHGKVYCNGTGWVTD
jgi:hypothetical protein